MTRKFWIILAAMTLTVMQTMAQRQVQRGQVKTPGRQINGSTYQQGQGLPGTTVTVKGQGNKIMNGSDKVKEQGFKYWKKTGKTSSPLYPQATEVPDDAMTVNVDVSSQSLNATLPNLQENMEYGYVAFVITDKGETYYGEEQSFSVDDPSGVVSAYMENLPDNVVKVYTLSGKIVYTGPEQGFNSNKGMYILRYPNGRSKKVVY